MKQLNQKEKQLLISVVAFLLSFGLVILVYMLATSDNKIKSQKVLQSVKGSFKADGPIEGSWIEMTAVEYDHNGEQTKVYYGGITRTEEGVINQYEFIADAYTGEILETFKL